MLTFVCAGISLGAGALIAFLAWHLKLKDIRGRKRRITVPEFIVAGIIIAGITFIVTMVVGPQLARESAIGGYHEFWNGSVTKPFIAVDECHRDGSCEHTYQCDKEEIWIPPETNSKGEVTRAGYYEIIWHSCPYATRELSYELETNIGKTFTIAKGDFEAHPQEWRSGEGLPSASEVPREPPERWLKAKADLENGLSDPVTKTNEYENYVLAADTGLYKEYEGSVETYQKAGLLPKHTAHLDESNMLFDYEMQAMKVQAVGGLKLTDLGEWQNRLMRFNAALGIDYQGDMHIVLLPADKVSNPDDYITALKAYWTNLGKWSISKNGIILAIGVSPDGEAVEWSRASTGMPKGNGEMVTALDLRLKGEPFDPGVLLGNVSTEIRTKNHEAEVVYDKSAGGAIGNIVFNEFPFARACMKCSSKGDHGIGYVDLTELVPVSTGAMIVMFIVVFVLAMCVWGLMLAFDPFGAIFGTSDNSPEEATDRYRL